MWKRWIFGLLLPLSGIALLLAWTTWREVTHHLRDAKDVITAQARSITDVIAESRSHALKIVRKLEDETAERLLNNARWVARQDAIAEIDSEQLERFADAHHLHRINLFDADGRRVATSHPEVHHEDVKPHHQPLDYFMPILEGKTDTLRIGFKPARFHEGRRYAVAVARPGGGVVVANIDAEEMLAMMQEISPEHLITALGMVHGVRYVAIQRDGALVAASLPEERIPEWDPASVESLDGGPMTREIQTEAGPVLEVAEPVTFPGEAKSLLRVGLDGQSLATLRGTIRRDAFIRFGVLLISACLGGALLLAWQRHDLLGREVRRVRNELSARELDARRTEKLTAMGALASGIAHQIRNPLNTIHLIAQRLSTKDADPARVRSHIGHVLSESARIEGIVQQFLEFARPRAPHTQEFDVGQAAEVIARAHEPAFAAAGVELALDTQSVRARLDRAFVVEILENLLRNAREASSGGDRVELDVRRNGSFVEIAVADQGPGVPERLRERIFDLYFTTKQNGTGLGLSLVANMVGAMGGVVRLSDETDRGARFIVQLPLMPPPD